MSTAKQKVDALLLQLALLVVNWNKAEHGLTWLLRIVVHDSKAIDILTAHMTAEAKTQALKVLATEMPPGDVVDRLLHACKFFDILREWRNLYVHNIGSTFGVGETDAIGTTRQVKARNRLIIRTESVTVADLERAVTGCNSFSDFVGRLAAFIEYQGKDASNVRLSDGSEISLPGMPPLPLSLEEIRNSQRQR